MPIYAYRCGACGHAKDILQKLSDPLLTVCPACGAESFAKQLTAAGFQLKGSGWYVTDFRDGKQGAKPDAAKPTDAAKAGEPGGGAAVGESAAKSSAGADGKQGPAAGSTGSATSSTHTSASPTASASAPASSPAASSSSSGSSGGGA